jgi:CRP-like cAMP-binding protein
MQRARRLSSLPLFKSVPLDDLEIFSQLCKFQCYSLGQTVFSQGDTAAYAMLLVSGKLEVSVQTETTDRQVGWIHPGETFGEQGLFHSRGIRNATVVAVKGSRCLILDSRSLRRAEGNLARIALERQLAAAIARRIRSGNLVIQRAWKEQQPDLPPPPPPTVLNRLRSWGESIWT